MEFETNDPLLAWMEDEGLSPFTLLKISPRPTTTGRKLPGTVVMEWGLEDLEYEGRRDRVLAWQVTAEEVRSFRCNGKVDPFEECHASFGDETGIDLRFEVGGSLLLQCRRLVVGDEPVVRFRKGRPRPHHGEFHLQLDLATTTWGGLRGWLSIPSALACVEHLTNAPVGDQLKTSDAKVVTIVDQAGHDFIWMRSEGDRLSVSRGNWASDELWNSVWAAITRIPGVTRISSRDLVSPPAIWPAVPPPKPAPKVWPHVYRVACEFDAMTLDALRECLKLPASSRFVFDKGDPIEPHAELTLGEAARRSGRTAANGTFQNESGGALVHCRADVREGGLIFQREPACDDATWQAVWRAPERLVGVRERTSRTTCSPPDHWPVEPPAR